MAQIFVTIGAGKGFSTEVDRVPVKGDYIVYQGANYAVQVVLMNAGGGTTVAAAAQQAEARLDSGALVAEPAAG